MYIKMQRYVTIFIFCSVIEQIIHRLIDDEYNGSPQRLYITGFRWKTLLRREEKPSKWLVMLGFYVAYYFPPSKDACLYPLNNHLFECEIKGLLFRNFSNMMSFDLRSPKQGSLSNCWDQNCLNSPVNHHQITSYRDIMSITDTHI